MESKPLGDKFWGRWLKANELDKLKIIEELPIFKAGVLSEPTATPTLINSYFVDLTKYVTTQIISLVTKLYETEGGRGR